MRALGSLGEVVDELLPKKYQVVRQLLSAILLEDLINARLDRLKAARDDAINEKQAFKAVVNAMAVALNGEEGKRAYFRNQ